MPRSLNTIADTRHRARRHGLRDFLRDRRARIGPADAGLRTEGGRRRTPGLRREEVAVLAGVGPSWYQWLEQGRDINVSPQVLDAIGRVLQLDDDERRHLYVLAGLNPPLPDPAPRLAHCEGLHRLLRSWEPYPATILDRYWNTVAANEPARRALGCGGPGSNHLTDLFLDESLRRRLRSWDDVARAAVASYRAVAAEQPEDPEVQRIVADLAAHSEEFRELWTSQDVRPPGMVVHVLDHPSAGTLSFESSLLRLPARPDVTLTLYNPLPGTSTDERMADLDREPSHGIDAAPGDRQLVCSCPPLEELAES